MIINKFYSDIKRPMLEKRDEIINQNKPNVDLVYFGDSILQGFDAARFGGSQKYIINSAIGGDTLEFMAKRIDHDVFKYNPSQVLFLGGINDIRAWYNEQRKVEDIPMIVNKVVRQYKHVVDKCIKQEIELFPCTIILNSEDKNNYPFLNLVISEINQNLKTIFEELNLEYVDLNSILINKYSFLSRDLTDDGLHPNDYGNLEIYKLLKDKEIL